MRQYKTYKRRLGEKRGSNNSRQNSIKWSTPVSVSPIIRGGIPYIKSEK